MDHNNKPKRKVLFVRTDDSLYERLAKLAEKEDRSINSMATVLLKKGLEIVEKVERK